MLSAKRDPRQPSTVELASGGAPPGATIAGPAGVHIVIVEDFRPPGPDWRAIHLVDGVRLDSAGLAAAAINPAEIDRIEVVKGPAAIERFGPEARWGVVLITTRRAAAPH